jgi:glucose/mannose-6-phosphate isomerase
VAAEFDEALLDDPQARTVLDHGRLLWSLAGAGAQVRHAVETLAEFDPAPLAGQRPRAVLLAGDEAAHGALRVLAQLIAPSAPVVLWAGAELPEWAGPLDALLVAALDGRHPRVVSIVGQAGRRGLLTAVAAPTRSPVAEAAGRSPVAVLEVANPRVMLWAALTPLLQAAAALGVVSVDAELLEQVADALDAVAESVRPDADMFTNPAKSLAADLAASSALVAGAGPLAAMAAGLFAADLRLLAGSPAVAIRLPDQLATGAALLQAGPESAGAPYDFFRDRIEAEPTRPRLVLVGDDAAGGPVVGVPTWTPLDESAAARAAGALREIAAAHGAPAVTVQVPPGPALCRFASATAFGAFTATYLALGLGIDPSAPRPGEVAQ